MSGSDCQRLGDFICEMCKQREETVARQKEIAARAGGAQGTARGWVTADQHSHEALRVEVEAW